MNNSDSPIAPVQTRQVWIGTDDDGKEILATVNGGNGLTKREHFAAMAMQGMLANDLHCQYEDSDLATYAVTAANALLKALEESQ